LVASDPGEGKLHRRHIRKDVAVFPQRAEFVIGERAVIVRRALPGSEDVDHLRRPQRDDRAQNDAINESEDGGVDTDRDRESEDSDGGKARRLDQLPESELEILYHRKWDAARDDSGFRNFTVAPELLDDVSVGVDQSVGRGGKDQSTTRPPGKGKGHSHQRMHND
jgi:hypothetical protein